MSPDKSYPNRTIETLLDTDYVTAATKAALEPRLATGVPAPAYFSADSFHLLTILCQRLLALEDGVLAARIAAGIDERLAADKSNGWRYRQMPGDRIAYDLALYALDETAKDTYQNRFADLPEAQQLLLMLQLQKGEVSGDWKQVSPKLFWEELLCEATEIFYSYPYAQNEIGFVGMADGHGWKQIGISGQEDPEPQTHTHLHP